MAVLWTNLMPNSFILCCNFCACKSACTVVVRSPREWWGTVFPGVGNDKVRGGVQIYNNQLLTCVDYSTSSAPPPPPPPPAYTVWTESHSSTR